MAYEKAGVTAASMDCYSAVVMVGCSVADWVEKLGKQ